MEQQTLRSYWWIVISRASRKAWKASGVAGKLAPVIVATFVSIALKPPKTVPEFLQSNSVVIGVIIVAIYILALLWFIGREPFNLHNEREVYISQLQDDNRTLNEKLRPKLELGFDDNNVASRAYSDPDSRYVFRIKVNNVGNEQVRDIVVEIRETRPATYDNFPIELHLMNNAPNSLNPAQMVFVNVIQANLVMMGDLFFCTNDPDWRDPFPLQDYEILISVSGHNSPMIEKWFRFSMKASDTGHTPTFKEGNQ